MKHSEGRCLDLLSEDQTPRVSNTRRLCFILPCAERQGGEIRQEGGEKNGKNEDKGEEHSWGCTYQTCMFVNVCSNTVKEKELERLRCVTDITLDFSLFTTAPQPLLHLCPDKY